ncbi:MAG TPA: DVUA0089 family protein [Planctomycetota bacterium]|nr:DVUA0089 family protein [Planctomycetota bacterium]
MHRRLLTVLLPSFCCSLLSQSLPELEPNDTPATASLLLSGVQSYGAIGVSLDLDYYAFTLTVPSDVRAMTAAGFGGSDVGDTTLTLFAPDGTTVLAFNDDFTGRAFYSQVTVGNLAAGTYFILVQGFSSAETGPYTLDLCSTPPGDLVQLTGALNPVSEGAEPNDPRQSGGAATVSSVFSRNLGSLAVGNSSFAYSDPTADYDFYAFTVVTTGNHTITTQATGTLPAAGRCSDTCIWLVDANNTVLAANDDIGGGNFWSQVTFDIATPGTYFAVVAAYAAPGGYLLDIIGSVPPLPSVTNALFSASAGGCPGSAGTPHLDTRADSITGQHSELPLLGTEFVVDLTLVPAGAPYFKILGFLPFATPFDLGPLGAPGCFVEVDLVNTILGFADAAGVGFWSLSLPYVLALRGLPLEMQAAVFDPSANALGVTVSNRGSAVCGNGY